MIEDTQTVAGYTILRDEPHDAAPDLSNSQHLHPLGMFSTLHVQLALAYNFQILYQLTRFALLSASSANMQSPSL
jgi:hypothetical protein